MQHDDREQEKRHRLLKSWEKTDQTERDNFLKAALTRREGRRYLMWLLDISNALGLQDQLFTGHALTTAHATGMHEVGKQIFAHLLETAPDDFMKMLKENASERADRESKSRITTESGTYTGPDAYTTNIHGESDDRAGEDGAGEE